MTPVNPPQLKFKFLHKTDLVERLKELGVEPKRSLGQNFLVSERAVEKIIDASQRLAKLSSSVVEVGPGLGSLTESLMRIEKPLHLIEFDRTFAGYWRERGCIVSEGDALKLDWTKLELEPNALLVSNLPYQISSSLVIERSVTPAGIARMILMFQKEVAQRLMAQARTSAYGLLTVIAQTFWRLDLLLEAAPREFFPVPNVASRVVMFERLAREWPMGTSAADYLGFVKAGFAQRRKLMLKNLVQGWKSHHPHTSEILATTFASQGLDVRTRAEELDPAQFLRLYLASSAALNAASLSGTK